jgi:hypothetical protein
MWSAECYGYREAAHDAGIRVTILQLAVLMFLACASGAHAGEQVYSPVNPRLRGLLHSRRQATKLPAGIVPPHRNGSPHGKRPPFATLNHSAADLGIPSESDLLRIGIRRACRWPCCRPYLQG